MSILISGMKMPESCQGCPCSGDKCFREFYGKDAPDLCNLLNVDVTHYANSRHKDCPLIEYEIYPSEKGEVIDDFYFSFFAYLADQLDEKRMISEKGVPDKYNDGCYDTLLSIFRVANNLFFKRYFQDMECVIICTINGEYKEYSGFKTYEDAEEFIKIAKLPADSKIRFYTKAINKGVSL